MSMPWWKWAQEPSGGSQANPVHPKFWVTSPTIGHASDPLYSDGMLPCWACFRTIAAIVPVSRFWAAAARASALTASFWLRWTAA